MKTLLALLIAVTCIAVVTVTAAVADQPRIALVLGNNDYRGGRLVTTGADAKLIAESLNRLGFNVIDLYNLDLVGLKRAVKEFGVRLKVAGPKAVGVFYYAGYGVQVGGQNYLVPIGIKGDGGADAVALNVATVLDGMKQAGNSLNFVILDASYVNPFGRALGARKPGLAAMEPPMGALVAFSAAPDKASFRSSGDYSRYTKALVKNMETERTSVSQLFQLVRMSVMGGSLTKQIPWERSTLTDEFFFTP